MKQSISGVPTSSNKKPARRMQRSVGAKEEEIAGIYSSTRSAHFQQFETS